MNRLQYAHSPYLLQHADNPVDWFEWCDDAFQKAKQEEKPIFLSIGYAACHWCHVMEHESFSDIEVAEYLNQHFVSVKVDREERPDIDHIYMTVCQAMTGSGGWPLTIIMDYKKRPFFAGTYFPKHSKYNRAGLLDVLHQVVVLWNSDRDKILNTGAQVTEYLQGMGQLKSGEMLKFSAMDKAFQSFILSYDSIYGGFGSTPKFPTPHNITFLLRYYHRTKNVQALDMINHTLNAMYQGGMYDHIGYGFHRYSTDAQWLVPHFEKMLYDQALLISAYTDAYLITKYKVYLSISQDIVEYVLREMTAPEGGFYSSQDADSEGQEGKYYVWTKQKIFDILGEEDGKLFCEFYDITEQGNWEGENILHIRTDTLEYPNNNLVNSRIKLLETRKNRIPPAKDDKILTDWNGLMIASLAKLYRITEDLKYFELAKNAADFILKELTDYNGYLYHRYHKGNKDIPGFIDDYAFMIDALMELYQAAFDTNYLMTAIELMDKAIELFWDDKGGGFYFSSSRNERMLTRNKQIYDGAIPSGNSIMISNLAKLTQYTMNPEYEEKAHQTVIAFSGAIENAETGFAQYLQSVDLLLSGSKQIVIAGDLHEGLSQEHLHIINNCYLPSSIIIFNPESEDLPAIRKLLPFLNSQRAINNQTTVYICNDYSCKAPVSDSRDLLYLLENG
jgi:uncharacterized protein